MASPRTRRVLQELKSDSENNRCFECSTHSPQWVSVNLSIFICLECSGKHRGLGVHLSFVRSISMDKWKETELAKMKVGGNLKARLFFEEEEPDWDSMSIHQRYNSKAAALYRDKISALAEGREWNRDEALKRVGKTSNHSSSSNHLSHSKSAGALSNSYQDGPSGGYQDQSTYQSREFKDQRDNFFNNLQAANAQRPDSLRPSEGGKYAGFGNTVQPPPRSQSDVAFDATLSSLSTGWNLLSFGANKVKENAFKFGSIASAKVVEVSQTVTEKVKEGNLLEAASKEAANLASKVNEFSKKGFSGAFSGNTGYNDIEKTSHENVQSNQDWNWVDDVKSAPQSYQNADDGDDWNGFSEPVPVAKPAQKTASTKKSKPTTEEDFSGLDVKSTVAAPKASKTKKEEDDIWDILNS